MPRSAPHPCAHPGCGALVHTRYCDAHQRQAWRTQNERRRGSAEGRASQSFYWSRAWRRARLVYLASHPLCVMHEGQGRVVPATEVDHIVPIAQGGDPWSEANWQALCKSCHSAKTLRESARTESRRGE